ncbi:MAG TPA: hypothetical protein VN844_20875, partial [Pyrinomonadaceae bacterium]|nr:hypothetical protein [Pyrinomonadaceae bacterium]
MATGEDYRYHETEGGAPGLMTRFMHWYMDRVLQLATREVAVRSVLLQVFNLLIPPSALFRRAILLRVIREAIKPARPQMTAPRVKRQVLYETRYGRETS